MVLTNPIPPHRYVEENSSVAMLTAKRSAGVTPEVNFKKDVTHMPPPSANKAAHSGLKTHRRHHQSKTEVSVIHKKYLCHQIFKKEVKSRYLYDLWSSAS